MILVFVLEKSDKTSKCDDEIAGHGPLLQGPASYCEGDLTNSGIRHSSNSQWTICRKDTITFGLKLRFGLTITHTIEHIHFSDVEKPRLN